MLVTLLDSTEYVSVMSEDPAGKLFKRDGTDRLMYLFVSVRGRVWAGVWRPGALSMK